MRLKFIIYRLHMKSSPTNLTSGTARAVPEQNLVHSLCTKSIVAAVLALLSTPSHAADRYIVRDNSGKRIETVEESYDDRWIRRDASGKRIGTIEKDIGDRTILRDANGKRTGTVEEGIGDRLTIRDSSGRTTHRTEHGYGKRKEIRDSNSHLKGTIER